MARPLQFGKRGELASTQDRENWNDRVRERREDFAEPFVVRLAVDRFIKLGILPAADYTVRWPRLHAMTQGEAVAAVKAIAEASASLGTAVMIVDELREQYLDRGPIEDVRGDRCALTSPGAAARPLAHVARAILPAAVGA